MEKKLNEKYAQMDSMKKEFDVLKGLEGRYQKEMIKNADLINSLNAEQERCISHFCPTTLYEGCLAYQISFLID